MYRLPNTSLAMHACVDIKINRLIVISKKFHTPPLNGRSSGIPGEKMVQPSREQLTP